MNDQEVLARIAMHLKSSADGQLLMSNIIDTVRFLEEL